MRRLVSLAAAGLIVAASATTARADTFLLNYEAPGVQHTTAGFTTVGVENFDTRTNLTGFVTDFGTNGAVTATYSPALIYGADIYGGAGGTGQYIAAFGGYSYSLKLTADPTVFPDGINYFGYWLSALDTGNQVAFYRGGVQVGALTPSDVLTEIGGNPAYFGNPNAKFLGANSEQPYAFINFYDTDGSFDEIRFSENPAIGGYESDNHTVGFYTSIGGVGGTPEPATWALMITGFGLVGTGLRRRHAVAA